MTRSANLRRGRSVRWKWNGGDATGKGVERLARRAERTLKGSKIVRKGSPDDPAYLSEQADGGRAWKLGSELEAG